MKKSNLRNPALIFAGISMLSFSSCNRGMGCPTFSLNSDVIEICTSVLAVLSSIF